MFTIPVMQHLSHVTCLVTYVIWRVCNQQGLPRLVSSNIALVAQSCLDYISILKAIKRNLPLCGPNYCSLGGRGWPLFMGLFIYFFIHLLALCRQFLWYPGVSLPRKLAPVPFFLSYMSPPIHHLTTIISRFSCQRHRWRFGDYQKKICLMLHFNVIFLPQM